MSGINTLIDTLMHQVLGRRVDTPPPRELAEPVRPLAPSEAPRALHSDSRLDARPHWLPETAATPRQGGVAGASPAAPGATATPPSTETHLSATARTIADLLLRFPAPPSALRPARPLLPEAAQAPPERVAERLSHSIRDSGLFYESHLARWYRGELPRLQLQREPQMGQSRPLVPASPEAARAQLQPLRVNLPGLAEGARGAAPSPTSGMTEGRGPAAPGASPGMAAAPLPGPGPSADPTMPRTSEGQAHRSPISPREPMPEALQGVVRHQLELLVTPVLRWEGDVWSGLFMALAIGLPPAGREDGEGADAQDDAERQEAQGWRSEMRLQVAGLGEVGVTLWLRRGRLDLDLSAAEPGVRERLAAGRAGLTARLERVGLDAVRVRVLDPPGEDER